MKTQLSFNKLILPALLLGSTGLAHAGTQALPPDWRYNGRADSKIKAEVKTLLYDGAYAQMLQLSATPFAADDTTKGEPFVHQSMTAGLYSADLTKIDTLQFKAKFDAVGGAVPELKIHLLGGGVNISKTFTPKDGTPTKDGMYSFNWDFVKQATGLSRPSGKLTEIRLSTNARSLKENQRIDISIIDLVFEGANLTPKIEQRVAPSEWKTTGAIKTRDLPLKGWKPDKADTAKDVKIENVSVTVGGKKLPALRLTYGPAKAFSPISLPFVVDAEKENVFTFQAKVEAPVGSKQLGDVEAPMTGWYSQQFNAFYDNFGVTMQDRHGVDWAQHGVSSTHFLQHLDKSQPVKDGFRTFRWDMKHENPTGNKGFNLNEVASVKVVYDNRKLKEGQKTVITIVSPQFVSGTLKTGGDMQAAAEFEKYRETYQPDYSDSSKYLGAPEKGRLPQPLSLVKDGKPLAEIVGDPSVWTPAGNGVFELYRWLYRLSDGVTIPMVKTPSDKPNVKIFVGENHAKEHFAEDLAALKGSDGCAIRTRGNNVYIFGATGKGTLNGVYTFLEGNTDVIWPHPTEQYGAIFTVNPNLAISWGDYLHRAPARYWGWMDPATNGPTVDYQIRNRANYLGLRSTAAYSYWGLYKEQGGGHNLHSWIPMSLFPTNPEYWALIDGVRQRPNGYRNQICLSNPDGRNIFISTVRKYIDMNPDARVADCFNIKIEDNWGVCECPECIRPLRLPDGSLLTHTDINFRSTQFFMFLNGVANALHNDGLSRMDIGTYVYFYTVPVPKVPISSYIRPFLADYVRKDYKQPLYAPINDIWWRVLNEWSQVSDQVVMREYTGLEIGFRSLAEVAQKDIQSQIKAGTYEFTSESLFTGSSQAVGYGQEQMDVAFMEYWMINRLYWEPDADVEQLRKWYIRRTFREAAPEIEKFYGTIRQLYFKEKRPTDFEENLETVRLVLRSGKEAELKGYLAKAKANVKHPLSKQLVNLVSNRFDAYVEKIKSE